MLERLREVEEVGLEITRDKVENDLLMLFLCMIKITDLTQQRLIFLCG